MRRPSARPLPVPLGDGKVVETGPKLFGSYGKYVDYGRDTDGNYITLRFAHLNSISVSEGDSVKRGQLLGKVGMTGHTDSPNVHIELRVNGEPYNLARFDGTAGSGVGRCNLRRSDGCREGRAARESSIHSAAG